MLIMQSWRPVAHIRKENGVRAVGTISKRKEFVQKN